MSTRRLIHTVFLFVLPIIVAWFGLTAWSAGLLVLVGLLWRWFIAVGQFVLPEKQPRIVLETIPPSSHRFNMEVPFNSLKRSGM
ncbi:MAG: hypothetical protein IIA12_03745 [Proteobacteria bacterium]|nr:hypothetical protein [Pseudomonadota bacterium]